MTNPVILLGTQSNGETLPVQVDATGRLVAEGLQGQQGEPGEPGPPGQNGQNGGSFPLPPNPYEGALLGWLNGGLAWVGTAPIPIPETLFGPITAYTPDSGFLEFAGEAPSGLGNGVYCYQCNEDGTHFTDGWNVSRDWSAITTFTNLDPSQLPSEWLFGGSYDGIHGEQPNSLILSWPSGTIFGEVELFFKTAGSPGDASYKNGDTEETIVLPPNTPSIVRNLGTVNLTEITAPHPSGGNAAYVTGIKLNGQLLVDNQRSVQWRVQNVLEGALTGVEVPEGVNLTVGKYLYVPPQRVAPWVLYGNDPTSLIDHLRRTRD